MNRFIDQRLNALERRFGSWAIPGLIRYFGATLFAVYLIGGVIPHLGATLDFNWERILAGEVWRPFTFIITTAVGTISPIGVLFGFFGMIFMFTFSDGLEQQWGVFRANLYFLWGWFSSLLGVVLVQWLTGAPPAMAGIYLATTILFAFATYNPKFTIMLMMFIPTPIWVIAVISGVMVASNIGNGLDAAFVSLCLSNYLLVAIPRRFAQAKQQGKSRSRRKTYQAASLPDSDAFNNCAVCGATEISHPEVEFRVGADGKDYCEEHLPK